MPAHRYVIGQAVRMKRTFGLSPAMPGPFRITGTLPERHNSPQYRMRNDAERHDRVMTEDEIEAVDMPLAPAATAVWQ